MKEIYIAVVIVIVLSQATNPSLFCQVLTVGANDQRKLICAVSMLGLGYCLFLPISFPSYTLC